MTSGSEHSCWSVDDFCGGVCTVTCRDVWSLQLRQYVDVYIFIRTYMCVCVCVCVCIACMCVCMRILIVAQE